MLKLYIIFAIIMHSTIAIIAANILQELRRTLVALRTMHSEMVDKYKS